MTSPWAPMDAHLSDHAQKMDEIHAFILPRINAANRDAWIAAMRDYLTAMEASK